MGKPAGRWKRLKKIREKCRKPARGNERNCPLIFKNSCQERKKRQNNKNRNAGKLAEIRIVLYRTACIWEGEERVLTWSEKCGIIIVARSRCYCGSGVEQLTRNDEVKTGAKPRQPLQSLGRQKDTTHQKPGLPLICRLRPPKYAKTYNTLLWLKGRAMHS